MLQSWPRQTRPGSAEEQCIEQVGTSCTQRGYFKPAQPDIHQDRAHTCANEEMPVRAARCRYSFEQSQLSFNTRVALGAEHHACPNLAELGGSPLVDRCVDARAVERHSSSNAADSAADDTDIEFMLAHCLYCARPGEVQK